MEQKIKDLIELYEYNMKSNRKYIDALMENGNKEEAREVEAQIRLYMEVINDLRYIVEGK